MSRSAEVRQGLRRVVARRLPPSLYRSLRMVRDEIVIARVSRRSRRSLTGWAARGETRVHLGCGADVRPGWLNIDLPSPQGTSFRPTTATDAVFIAYDLRRGLPLPAGSCRYIYSSHFLEHLDYADSAHLVRDCYRALTVGGIFRCCLPDFAALCRAYVAGDRSYFALINEAVLSTGSHATAPLVDYINYVVYQGGEHRCVYDADKMVLLLQRSGFRRVRPTGYQEGTDPPSELRQRYSFYVEAVK